MGKSSDKMKSIRDTNPAKHLKLKPMNPEFVVPTYWSPFWSWIFQWEHFESWSSWQIIDVIIATLHPLNNGLEHHCLTCHHRFLIRSASFLWLLCRQWHMLVPKPVGFYRLCCPSLKSGCNVEQLWKYSNLSYLNRFPYPERQAYLVPSKLIVVWVHPDQVYFFDLEQSL